MSRWGDDTEPETFCTFKKKAVRKIRLWVSHLVGLVDVVAVQGAEQMLQAGHVVVVDGVDDGLHHEGVFLILNRWEQQLLFHCSKGDDLILWALILFILPITCPPKSLFHLSSQTWRHWNKQKNIIIVVFIHLFIFTFASAAEFQNILRLFQSLSVICDPITLSQSRPYGVKLAVMLCCTKRRGDEGKEVRRRRRGRWGEDEEEEARLMWHLLDQA